MQKARQVAAEFRHTYGYEIPVDYLASRLADQAQVYTQVSSSCPLADMCRCRRKAHRMVSHWLLPVLLPPPVHPPCRYQAHCR